MRTDQIPHSWLGQRITLAEVRQHAPGPSDPPEHRRAWLDFIDIFELPYDELWTYHECYDERLAAALSGHPNGWSGFVILRLGEIIASYDLRAPRGESLAA